MPCSLLPPCGFSILKVRPNFNTLEVTETSSEVFCSLFQLWTAFKVQVIETQMFTKNHNYILSIQLLSIHFRVIWLISFSLFRSLSPQCFKYCINYARWECLTECNCLVPVCEKSMLETSSPSSPPAKPSISMLSWTLTWISEVHVSCEVILLISRLLVVLRCSQKLSKILNFLVVKIRNGSCSLKDIHDKKIATALPLRK